MNTIELLGYLGTFFVVISFMVKDIFYLRGLNVIGAILITIYAIIINAWPVALLDGFIVLINLYHLIKLKKEKGK